MCSPITVSSSSPTATTPRSISRSQMARSWSLIHSPPSSCRMTAVWCGTSSGLLAAASLASSALTRPVVSSLLRTRIARMSLFCREILLLVSSASLWRGSLSVATQLVLSGMSKDCCIHTTDWPRYCGIDPNREFIQMEQLDSELDVPPISIFLRSNINHDLHASAHAFSNLLVQQMLQNLRVFHVFVRSIA